MQFLNQPPKRQWEYLLFGGSFDPPHLGHLSIMHYVLKHGLCHKLLVMPAALSPWKEDSPPTASPDERLALLRLLIEELPEALHKRVSIEEFELRQAPPSYTINTIRHLQKKLLPKKDLLSSKSLSSPKVSQRLGLLLGGDSAEGLPGWHQAKAICETTPLVVFMRKDNKEQIRSRLKAFAKEQSVSFIEEPLFLDNPLVSCSSTELRRKVAKGEDVGSCLPRSLQRFCEAHDLYHKRSSQE